MNRRTVDRKAASRRNAGSQRPMCGSYSSRLGIDEHSRSAPGRAAGEHRRVRAASALTAAENPCSSGCQRSCRRRRRRACREGIAVMKTGEDRGRVNSGPRRWSERGKVSASIGCLHVETTMWTAVVVAGALSPRTRSACCSSRKRTWSVQPGRIVPITRSQNAFACGERGGVMRARTQRGTSSDRRCRV